jgi:lysophospholipase L1-like esterase
MRLPQFSLLIVFFCCLGCFSAKQSSVNTDTLPAAGLRPFGRTWMHPEQGLELISSATHFGFQFEGPECRLYATVPAGMDHNYIQYELDGKYEKRLVVSGKVKTPIVLKATGNGPHKVWVYKATEAHTGAVFIQQVDGKNLKALSRPSAPLIEFIGNSITCGAAADASEVPCGTGAYHDQHNAYYAYGPRVARTLKANFLLSSVSGIGIYRNWNSEAPTMPQVYEKASFGVDEDRRWDFKRYNPKIVSIALGTNDFSNGDGKKPRLPFDSAVFVQNYVQFVQLVKSKYPEAKIALLSSPMVKGSARERLQNCLLAVKAQTDALYPAQKAAVFFFKPMDARGCTGHPNVEDHALLAKELEPFFTGLLK